VQRLWVLLPGRVHRTEREREIGQFSKIYIHDAVKIMVAYEFDKAKFAKGWGIISKHLEVFRSIPGFAPSAPIPPKGKGL
jgi:hypothetical protein